MKILVILAHPNRESFNHAIAETTIRTLLALGYQVVFHDLCEEQFPPCLPTEEIPSNGVVPSLIELHCKDLAEADGIIIVHPNWWGQPPAILKGWIDRVIRPDVAYRFEETDSGEGVPFGLLRAKVGMVFNTSNTPKEREQTVFHDPLERIWKDCIFGLCGVPQFVRRMFGVIVTSSPEERANWLREVESTVAQHFPSLV
jgi:putative NADPH-quinone reductase